MATPTVYVICDANCKWEGMTREQILTAITQAVNEGTISDIDTGFVQSVKTIGGTPLRFFVGTQAEYDALEDEEKINLYAIITNDTTKEGMIEAIESLLDFKNGIVDGTVYAHNATNAISATNDANGKPIHETYALSKNKSFIMRRFDIGEHLTTDFANKIRVGGTVLKELGDIAAVSFCNYKGHYFYGQKVGEEEADDNGNFVRFYCSLVPKGSATDTFFEIGRATVKIYKANGNFYIVLEDVSGLSYDFDEQAWGDNSTYFATWDTMAQLNNVYLYFV